MAEVTNIRGRRKTRIGLVTSNKMDKTITISVERK
jgi:ribosomal protein S17